MKEDILEQLVEDWLQSRGYFTRANLKFKPSKEDPGYGASKDCVASDIDVIGINPCLSGHEAVMVVGCKSWQGGFNIAKMRDSLLHKPEGKVGNKPAWKHFRELVIPKWTAAFMTAIKERTGSDQFTYVTAVTLVHDERNKPLWEDETAFRSALGGNPLRFMTLKDMLTEVFEKLGTSVESSQFSRTLQLIKAAGLDVSLKG